MAWLSRSRIRQTAMVGTGLVELRWRFLPRALYCFNFHRIGDAARSPYDRGVFSCTEGQFEQVVLLIKSRFEVVNLAGLLEIADGHRGRPARPLALITFDDGYLDNFAAAMPILNRHALNAVFFVATSHVDDDRVPWWDEIAWCVRNSPRESIRLRGVAEPFQLKSADTEETIRRVLRVAKRRTDMAMQDSVDEIRAACGAPQAEHARDGERLFMSWDHIRQLAAFGHDVGSHTVSHRLLAHLSADEQLVELSESKARIEAHAGCDVRAVAYPVGGLGAFDAQTCRLARQAGYRFGFSFLPGCNRFPLQDRWALRRLAIHNPSSLQAVKMGTGFPSLS